MPNKTRPTGFATCLIVLTMTSPAWAQIINVQPSLTVIEENGLSGELTIDGFWKTGNTEMLSIKGSLATRYRYNKHYLYLIAAGRYLSVKQSSFDKQVSEHLRYRYEWTDWLAPEAYAQHEHNEFRRLLLRLLSGVGPRFTLYKSERLFIAFGTSYMIEYEEQNDTEDEAGVPLADASDTELNHRWSNYLSWNLVFDERLQLANTNYFQPRFDEFNDFRVLSEVAFVVKIVGTFSLKISAVISYDSRPALTVEHLDTYLGVGLNLTYGPLFAKNASPTEEDKPEPPVAETAPSR